ncbi:hypothetical protein AC579_2745 [Lecanosticta acicola]|uniref:DUF21-domain-containing protein n=1 Tax=Lecanosticta acicola TaxID=111012 RepID=A0AAI8YXK0_9PEZI|nr:hypothetical protein AC579_2745 [Lecanosticta acicola]
MSALAGRGSLQHHSRRVAASACHPRRGNGLSLTTVRPAILAAARLLTLPLAAAAPAIPGYWEHARLHTVAEGDEDLPRSPDDPDLWIYLAVAVALVLLGGIFAGLTIALMGQDETYLQVIASSGEGKEKQHAKTVLKLLKKGKHWVLVTLLLSNVITNETLPIVLDRSLGGGWPAVVSSTVLIVIFGEVAPQSVCVRFGLSIGSWCAKGVWVLMLLLSPVAWPTAKLLDWLLGEDHGIMYKKAGLKTLVTLHKTLGAGAHERLMEDEVTIINSVLDLKEKPVGDIMTPMQDVFTMSADTILDERMMDTILSQGYSRIPIYSPDNHRNFIGMLLVKILITYDPEDGKRVRDFALATLPETSPYTSCLDIINFFQEGKSHMVLVSDFPGEDKGALGVVTLEDVIEELIGEEIIDESDVFVDVHKAIRRVAPAPRTRYSSKIFASDYVVDSEDERKEATENEPLLGNKKGADAAGAPRKTSLQNGQTTFLMRRKSSTASDGARDHGPNVKPVPVRSSATDMREHLKHLGPSNAASNPRQTKFSNVKIKPGVGTIPEHSALSTRPKDNSPTSVPLGHKKSNSTPSATLVQEDDGNASDVDSLRGKVASGGVAAVYGTMGPSSPNRNRRLSGGERLSAQEASRVASENVAPPNSYRTDEPESYSQAQDEPSLPDKMVAGDAENENDDVGELAPPASPDWGRKRMAVRSGSITETHVDSGGLKKVVLGTTSSSEEDGVSPGDTQRSSRLWGSGESSKNEGDDEEGDEEEHEESSQPNGQGSANGAGGKKRRKKRGKRKKGGSGGGNGGE